jgi:dTDP-L-rhamnose 4-epimerase
MPHVLVTGGAGFIGSQVVEAAVERGWPVRVLDSWRGDVHASSDIGLGRRLPSDVEVVHADVRDASAVFDALDDIDVVSHQAAKVGLGVDFDDTTDYVDSNDLGTAVLLTQAARRGIRRLVLASSMVVYGEGRYRDALGSASALARSQTDLAAGRFEPLSPRTGLPMQPESINEDAPLDPRNVYAATKVAQENLVRAWARAGGGVAAMLRYHNVYGPRMPGGTPYAGVASLFRSALERGDAPQVFEDGAQRRDFVHVADVARANLAAIEWTSGREPGDVRAFNIASGHPHTVGEFAAALSRAYGGPDPIVTGEFRLGDVRHITASARRASRELGFTAQVDFERGVREFAAAVLRPAVERRSAER